MGGEVFGHIEKKKSLVQFSVLPPSNSILIKTRRFLHQSTGTGGPMLESKARTHRSGHPSSLHYLDISGRIYLYDLYDLAHVDGRKPNSLHELVRTSWGEYVVYRLCCATSKTAGWDRDVIQ